MAETTEPLIFKATKRDDGNVLTTVTAPDGMTLGIDRVKDVAEIFNRAGVKQCAMSARVAESELSELPTKITPLQDWMSEWFGTLEGTYEAPKEYMTTLCTKHKGRGL